MMENTNKANGMWHLFCSVLSPCSALQSTTLLVCCYMHDLRKSCYSTFCCLSLVSESMHITLYFSYFETRYHGLVLNFALLACIFPHYLKKWRSILISTVISCLKIFGLCLLFFNVHIRWSWRNSCQSQATAEGIGLVSESFKTEGSTEVSHVFFLIL